MQHMISKGENKQPVHFPSSIPFAIPPSPLRSIPQHVYTKIQWENYIRDNQNRPAIDLYTVYTYEYNTYIYTCILHISYTYIVFYDYIIEHLSRSISVFETMNTNYHKASNLNFVDQWIVVLESNICRWYWIDSALISYAKSVGVEKFLEPKLQK